MTTSAGDAAGPAPGPAALDLPASLRAMRTDSAALAWARHAYRTAVPAEAWWAVVDARTELDLLSSTEDLTLLAPAQPPAGHTLAPSDAGPDAQAAAAADALRRVMSMLRDRVPTLPTGRHALAVAVAAQHLETALLWIEEPDTARLMAQGLYVDPRPPLPGEDG